MLNGEYGISRGRGDSEGCRGRATGIEWKAKGEGVCVFRNADAGRD
jgi:hypothetical protein